MVATKETVVPDLIVQIPLNKYHCTLMNFTINFDTAWLIYISPLYFYLISKGFLKHSIDEETKKKIEIFLNFLVLPKAELYS